MKLLWSHKLGGRTNILAQVDLGFFFFCLFFHYFFISSFNSSWLETELLYFFGFVLYEIIFIS
jgi:uncharacterized membrane protein (DUF485 family)